MAIFLLPHQLKPKFRPVQWNQLPKMVRVAATRAYFYLDHNIRPRVEKYDDGKYYWCHATDTWWMLVTR